jgi:excisionase family DNA binding protein
LSVGRATDSLSEPIKSRRNFKPGSMTANAKTKGVLNGITIADSVWLTASEAAQYLRVEPRTLLMWARQGRVKGYVLSGTQRVTWRFRAEDLDATMSPPSVALRNGRIQ